MKKINLIVLKIVTYLFFFVFQRSVSSDGGKQIESKKQFQNLKEEYIKWRAVIIKDGSLPDNAITNNLIGLFKNDLQLPDGFEKFFEYLLRLSFVSQRRIEEKNRKIKNEISEKDLNDRDLNEKVFKDFLKEELLFMLITTFDFLGVVYNKEELINSFFAFKEGQKAQFMAYIDKIATSEEEFSKKIKNCFEKTVNKKITFFTGDLFSKTFKFTIGTEEFGEEKPLVLYFNDPKNIKLPEKQVNDTDSSLEFQQKLAQIFLSGEPIIMPGDFNEESTLQGSRDFLEKMIGCCIFFANIRLIAILGLQQLVNVKNRKYAETATWMTKGNHEESNIYCKYGYLSVKCMKFFNHQLTAIHLNYFQLLLPTEIFISQGNVFHKVSHGFGSMVYNQDSRIELFRNGETFLGYIGDEKHEDNYKEETIKELEKLLDPFNTKEPKKNIREISGVVQTANNEKRLVNWNDYLYGFKNFRTGVRREGRGYGGEGRGYGGEGRGYGGEGSSKQFTALYFLASNLLNHKRFFNNRDLTMKDIKNFHVYFGHEHSDFDNNNIKMGVRVNCEKRKLFVGNYSLSCAAIQEYMGKQVIKGAPEIICHFGMCSCCENEFSGSILCPVLSAMKKKYADFFEHFSFSVKPAKVGLQYTCQEMKEKFASDIYLTVKEQQELEKTLQQCLSEKVSERTEENSSSRKSGLGNQSKLEQETAPNKSEIIVKSNLRIEENKLVNDEQQETTLKKSPQENLSSEQSGSGNQSNFEGSTKNKSEISLTGSKSGNGKRFPWEKVLATVSPQILFGIGAGFSLSIRKNWRPLVLSSLGISGLIGTKVFSKNN